MSALKSIPRAAEIDLHKAVIKLLQIAGDKEWIWHHSPNGEARDVRTGAKLKAMGVMPGWPDLTLISPDGRIHFVEFKTSTNKLSETQEQFQLECIKRGVPYSVVRSMNEAMILFNTIGILRGSF